VQAGRLKLSNIQYVVLDEADEMLSIGFADQIEEILSSLPKDRHAQTLLLSATMPEWVKNISRKYLNGEHSVIDLVKGEKVHSFLSSLPADLHVQIFECRR
jgi:ATP-dependent RNA helicase DDX21